MSTVFHTHLDSPIGQLRLRATDKGLVAIDHTNQQANLDPSWKEDKNASHPILRSATEELTAYFSRKLTSFTTPLAPVGTAFQLKVWDALQAIPYGTTRTYLDIANAIGNPKAVRAVGLANGKNPLSIFIPCHRVIGSNGKLTGYAGGLDAKRILLQLESEHSFSLN